MRISDWSSDVCSSDLRSAGMWGGQRLGLRGYRSSEPLVLEGLAERQAARHRSARRTRGAGAEGEGPSDPRRGHRLEGTHQRSAGRRVGKEFVSKGWLWWSLYNKKKKK